MIHYMDYMANLPCELQSSTMVSDKKGSFIVVIDSSKKVQRKNMDVYLAKVKDMSQQNGHSAAIGKSILMWTMHDYMSHH